MLLETISNSYVLLKIQSVLGTVETTTKLSENKK